MVNNKASLQVFTSPSTGAGEVYHFNFLGPILEPSYYVDLLQVLRSAEKDDEINLYLNTGGGRIDTTIQIINCMRNSKATLVTHLEGLCHSAGTYIFLSGDEFVVNPNVILLFHNYTGGAVGKGGEVIADLLANDVWIKQIADDIYYPFLSKNEIDKINEDKDRWMNADEVLERLERVVEYRKQITYDQEKEARRKLKEQIDLIVAQDVQDELADLAQEEANKKAEVEKRKEKLQDDIAKATKKLQELDQ